MSEALDFDFGEQDTANENIWVAILHLSSAVCLLVVPLLLWSWKKNHSPRIDKQGRQVLNFQITRTLLLFAGGLLLTAFPVAILVLDQSVVTSVEGGPFFIRIMVCAPIISRRNMSIDTVFQNFPQLETGRLILRRMQAADAQALFKVLSDDEVTRHYDDVVFTQRSQASEQIEAWENGYAHRRCIRWGIALMEDNAVIGSCGFYGIHPWHMRGSIGYELARPFWRKGIMTEALTALLALGFGDMGLNRIDAVVMPENVASVRLLEKLGFHNEGLLHGYENWGSKGFADLYMLAILKKAWEQSLPGTNPG